ncbi:conserved Plasmodium protein, unknown function [Plasmodium ovale curtisi]|uniref:Uncharacterized protein n=1 Tax=Plasmodium ovale curtisi TaxID=864141 RepID=A0A1A8WHD2_PLAOA|nr:conserved Plasmodium protein, unknown function [Plasmodium ovale curtisi]SBS91526.1 conserved Plasmodium protein, unknown function [Plasmodium ovale curtisi]
MEDSPNSEAYILFEGENEVCYDHFCYEYTEKKTGKKKLPNSQSGKTLSGRSHHSKWAQPDKVDFNCDILKKVTPQCDKRYGDLKKEELSFFEALHLLQSDMDCIGKHNLEDYLNGEDRKRRRKIPMLWVRDYKSAYSTNYTDEQRVRKKIEFIDNIMA